jgi:DNA-binding transcriptional LysR family regulator
MNLEHLKLFIRIAATHNISQAGAEMGLSPAVASAHINKLEQSLGVRLIHRTTRKVALTEDGQAFFQHAEDVLASVEAAKGSIGAGSLSPSGTLRIAASASFGRMHLVPALAAFMQTYPQLNIDLKLSDTIVDLVEGGFDIAVRNSELKDSSLVARKLATDKRMLCASPAYLAQYGTPQQPQDLTGHNCITLMGLDHWCFHQGSSTVTVKAKGNFRTDDGEAIRDACIDGIGITINSSWNAYQALLRGELVQVLADYPLASQTAIWAVYPSSRQLAPKVRAFIDYFTEHFGNTPYWDNALSGITAEDKK